jgi:hypothetical protein
MDAVIRKAVARDANSWLELLKHTLGVDYPDRRVYEAEWAAKQFDLPQGHETWVAEADGRIQSALSYLQPSFPNQNPVANLGRWFVGRDAHANGSAEALLRELASQCEKRRQLVVIRVQASDLTSQNLVEKLGFCCVGFQPYKHLLKTREGALFYVRMASPTMLPRLPLSESLSQVSELAEAVLANTGLPRVPRVRDGVTGYPLQTECQFRELPFDHYSEARDQAQQHSPPLEISGGFNLGWGMLRVAAPVPINAIVAERSGQVAGGIAYVFDENDRCLRLADGFAIDDITSGALLQRLVKLAQEKFNAVYVEADVLMAAPKMLKSAEQLGFVPVAYLPGFSCRATGYADVVKLVKLNLAYSVEDLALTSAAKGIVDIIDHNFQDQKMGVAIINMLRGLSIFDGLGDGELRKISRLFTQKLYRQGEKVFHRGDVGSEAYIVMRGQVDILRDDDPKPLASFGTGQIFGELAFLDGAPRTAQAVIHQPSILLVVQRDAFNELVQREPHLGMVVMRNIATELSHRMRRTSHGLPELPKA